MQALGRLTLLFTFFTTVKHCHCQTHHCKMLNNENGQLKEIFQGGKIEKVSTRQFGPWTIPQNQGR
jgi:hypothetical protein